MSGRPLLGGRLMLKLGAEETGGIYGVRFGHTPPGKGSPLHVHEREDEVFYVLDGMYEFSIGERIVQAAPGTCGRISPVGPEDSVVGHGTASDGR